MSRVNLIVVWTLAGLLSAWITWSGITGFVEWLESLMVVT